MGSISAFDIQSLKENYNLVNYVETGTGTGSCLDYATLFNFDSYYSVEILTKTFNNVLPRYKLNSKVTLLNDNSENGLRKIIADLTGPTLFWLDAHFPGVGFGRGELDTEQNRDIRIPLEKEIGLLVSFDSIKQSVIIIDDLRIYEDGPFLDGNLVGREKVGSDNIDFLNIFFSSHSMEKDYREQGYIILRPL